jgi:hypothetical protein
MLPRVSLLLTALAFGGFGTVLFAEPRLLEHTGVVATGPTGEVELRAFYGGLELGLAAFFLIASSRRDWHGPALVAQVLALGGSATGRLAGMTLAGVGGTLMWMLLIAETAGAILGAAALRSLRLPR